MLLWLWCRPAAIAPIGPLAWEPPYAVDVAPKSKKKNQNKISILVPPDKCNLWAWPIGTSQSVAWQHIRMLQLCRLWGQQLTNNLRANTGNYSLVLALTNMSCNWPEGFWRTDFGGRWWPLNCPFLLHDSFGQSCEKLPRVILLGLRPA